MLSNKLDFDCTSPKEKEGPMAKSPISLSTMLLAGAALVGCASAPPPPPATPAAAPAPAVSALKRDLEGAPAWVKKGCGAFFGEKKKLVCGVGAIGGMTNPGLARSAAEGRGRTEIARSLKIRCKSMLKDYQAAVQGGPGNKLNNEQYITDTSKQVTDMTLSGTRLEDSWVSDGGTFYALMVLDVDAFRDQVKNMSQLDEQIRQAIVERAEQSFAELDASTEGQLPPLESQQ
jgi:hypothetical protein